MVNISDIEAEHEVPENVMKAIFEKQMDLALKYKDIEDMGDLLETTKNNINTAKGQKWIKDFSWRVTEEICEALEAKPVSKEHYLEEITDALHFLTELSIIAGYDEQIVDVIFPHENKNEMYCVYFLGIMCNTLKNKPWKQTQMLTDRPKFEKYLRSAWRELIGIYYASEYTMNDIYIIYMKKHGVNQFRIRSKY